MKFFSKNEIIGVLSILIIIFIAFIYNLGLAQRRARDFQRRDDLGQITKALEKYYADLAFYPLGDADGKMRICPGDNFEDLVSEVSRLGQFQNEKYHHGLAPCDWGGAPLRDLTDPGYPSYLSVLPSDPRHEKGLSYRYESNGKVVQIFAHLEGGKTEVGYNQQIFERNILCGVKICNFGVSISIPLDKSISEYENELRIQ